MRKVDVGVAGPTVVAEGVSSLGEWVNVRRRAKRGCVKQPWHTLRRPDCHRLASTLLLQPDNHSPFISTHLPCVIVHMGRTAQWPCAPCSWKACSIALTPTG
jgi:hypothetical protein